MYTHHSLVKKLEAIRLYKLGYGAILIGHQLQISDKVISRWLYRYNQQGSHSLAKQPYTKSTPEFKISVVKEVLEKCLSCTQVAINNGISDSAVYSWVQRAKSKGYDSLHSTKPRGRPPQAMGRPHKREPQTELEKLQAENERLKTELALLKKVKALVEEKEARMRDFGRKPSKN